MGKSKDIEYYLRMYTLLVPLRRVGRWLEG